MTNADEGNETLLHVMRQWLKHPSNWLSLGSIVISVLTFLYVQLYPGQITIYMPKRLGVSAPSGAPWRFIVSASLFHEAPSTKVRIIEDATLNVRIGNAAARFKCPWAGTTELVTTEEYKTRFGKLNPGSEQYADQISPIQRVLPVALRGGELQTKMLVFACPPEGFAVGSVDPVPVETTLEIMTSTDRHTSTRAYRLYEKARIETANKSWTWIE